MAEIMRSQECCYLSTPKHLRSFVGRFLWIYTGKCSLSLNSEALLFSDTIRPFKIALDSITGLASGHYPRLAKPIRLDYISVTHNYEGLENTLRLTPSVSWSTPVWKTNILVASWMKSLKEAMKM